MLNENVPLTWLHKVRENPIICDKLQSLSEQDFHEVHSKQSATDRNLPASAGCTGSNPGLGRFHVL